MLQSSSNNRLRSLTSVTISTMNYLLEARLRTCIQRAAFCMHKRNAKPEYEIEPNRDLVLRDPKVLPEVRNRPLLVRELVSHSNFEILP